MSGPDLTHYLVQDRAACRTFGLSKAAFGPVATVLEPGTVWCPLCRLAVAPLNLVLDPPEG